MAAYETEFSYSPTTSPEVAVSLGAVAGGQVPLPCLDMSLDLEAIYSALD